MGLSAFCTTPAMCGEANSKQRLRCGVLISKQELVPDPDRGLDILGIMLKAEVLNNHLD